jgi:hypothetical protein
MSSFADHTIARVTFPPVPVYVGGSVVSSYSALHACVQHIENNHGMAGAAQVGKMVTAACRRFDESARTCSGTPRLAAVLEDMAGRSFAVSEQHILLLLGDGDAPEGTYLRDLERLRKAGELRYAHMRVHSRLKLARHKRMDAAYAQEQAAVGGERADHDMDMPPPRKRAASPTPLDDVEGRYAREQLGTRSFREELLCDYMQQLAAAVVCDLLGELGTPAVAAATSAELAPELLQQARTSYEILCTKHAPSLQYGSTAFAAESLLSPLRMYSLHAVVLRRRAALVAEMDD